MSLRALICLCGVSVALGAPACFAQGSDKPETVGASQSSSSDLPKPAPTNGLGEASTSEVAPAAEPAVTSAPAPTPAEKPAENPAAAPAPAAAAASADLPVPKPTAPSARSDTGPIIRPPVREGDEWIYRRFSGTASVLLRQRATGVKENGISLRTEQAGSNEATTAVYDREWGLLGSGYNDYLPALNYYAFSLYPGKRWRINAEVSNFGAGQKSRITGEGAALAFEEITVTAGRFTALKIIAEMEISDPGDAARIVRVKETHWYVREVMRPVKVESTTQLAGEAARVETIELVRYRLE